MSKVLENSIDDLLALINSSDNIVAITGAGVSTESNLPDFRSSLGLYTEQIRHISAEQILSVDYFKNNPLEFYEYYLKTFMHLDAQPNITHKFLSELERSKRLKMIITQNVEGLHQKAGSKNVIEIHGSIFTNKCISCEEEYSIDYINENHFCRCGNIIKPGIVLYGENYDDNKVKSAVKAIKMTDVLMILGTSLKITGIIDLINCYRKSKLIVLNKERVCIERQVNMGYGLKMNVERKPLLAIYEELGKIFRNIELNESGNEFRKVLKLN